VAKGGLRWATLVKFSRTYYNTMGVTIVVGGGIAGLYCAMHLPPPVLLIEASQRLGGRVHTVDGLEAGAGRFSPVLHRRLKKLIDGFGLTTAPNGVGGRPYDVALREVVRKAGRLPKAYLQGVSFHRACVDVVGPDAARELQSQFGYDAEFEVTNAWDALRTFSTDFAPGIAYHHCTQGLSSLIDAMASAVRKRGAEIRMGTKLSNIAWDSRARTFALNDGALTCHRVVLALPPDALRSVVTFPVAALDDVEAVSLHRLYARAARPHGLSRHTVDGPMRQVIPMDDRVFMVYNDTRAADDYHRLEKLGGDTLRRALQRDSGVKLVSVVSHYWPAGVHAWKPGVDSERVAQRMLQPVERVPLFVCGEAFSRHQGWIEGALQTAEDVLSKCRRATETEQRNARRRRGGAGQAV
jgi:monoamine oxidase